MPSRNLSDAHLILQTQFPITKAAFEKDNLTVEVFLTCTYRSPAEQTAYIINLLTILTMMVMEK